MTAFRIFRRLSELLDVLIASPADGEVLTYSSGAGKWENQAGGGAPAGDDAQVQFNDNGAFGASEQLVFSDTYRILGIGAIENGNATITAIALGAQLFVSAADGDATHPGGELTLTSGSAIGQTGGVITIVAGNDSADGDGGSVSIKSGTSTASDGGDINIRANAVSAAGNRGGDVNIVAGQGTVHGGNVTIQGGASDGNIQFYSGGGQYIQLDNNGLAIGADQLGFFGAARVAQPTGVPVSAAGIHAALVTLGLITA